ncbi:putative DMBT1-like protein isoform X2 [Kryptolebias marmoratus]|uniref:putative DMBT1-like protein isoform X2 n=1 Tax=Kryptolebias marmoratus TaxID=37003 RepID=UPI0018ACBF48|nr:putative DMBT1-like protein isoform X2 [Kryptolebias marmoratus]
MWTRQQENLHFFIFVSFYLILSSIAAGQIKLVGPGSDPCSGRIEVYHNNIWGTVCDDDWDSKDADVVCRQLNCGTSLGSLISGEFGEGTRQIWLDNVQCTGEESSLTSCQHDDFGSHNCGHHEDVGVICSESLPMPSISMNPAGEVTWGQDVRIVCLTTAELLGGAFILKKTSGSFREAQVSSSNSATFSLLKVNFDHDGSYQCQYEKNISGQTFTSPLSNSITLLVSASLQRPVFSLTYPDSGLVWGPKSAEVTMGSSFSFSCSTDSDYPQGFFSLIFSGSNMTETTPAVNNSATFNFPAAEFKHQGNYSCVYEVTLSTRRFTSDQAEHIFVLIKLSLLLRVFSIAKESCCYSCWSCY